MKYRPTRLPALALACAFAAAPLRGQAPPVPAAAEAGLARALPASTLAARVNGTWTTWWRSEAAPARWGGDGSAAPLARAAKWHRASDGVEWTELALGGSGEAWRTKVVAVRLDPARVALTLDTAFTSLPRRRPAWTAERVASRGDVAFAVNAGQFLSTTPWGWVVLGGREWLDAGAGPLASAFVIDASGRARLAHGDAATREVAARRDARWAFQSYPTLLADGAIPEPLRAPGRGIDVAHRDARAAIGTTADGRVIVAITRFDALGGRLSFVPFGLTVPEAAAVMGALGATDAVMLDGGISAQLLVREAGGEVRSWEGLRAVPLALVATTRTATPGNGH